MELTLRDIKYEDIPLLKPWLTDKENAKFMDPFFQNESLRDEQIAFFLMRKDRRTFLILCDSVPVGMMGLTNIDKINQSTEIWSLLGEKTYRQKGIITIGYVLTLKKAFQELYLHSVHAWVVDGNYTISVCEKLGFKTIGRQRQCHLFDGVFKDRILFDILRNEFNVLHSQSQIHHVNQES